MADARADHLERLPDAARVRLARIEDAGAIARIYNQGIADRIATFETEPQSEATVAARLRDLAPRYPAVVAESVDGVVAFAWTSAYRTRHCYDAVAEFSVYVDRDYRSRGLGRQTLTALITETELRGFTKLVSRVFPENTGSRRLCASLGFREVGVYRRHGKLEGAWKDCVVVERLMGEAAEGRS